MKKISFSPSERFADPNHIHQYRNTTHNSTPIYHPLFRCPKCKKHKSMIGSKGRGKEKRCKSCYEQGKQNENQDRPGCPS